MQRTFLALAVVALVTCGPAGTAAAQEYGWELIPTVGFRWGGGLSTLPSPIRELDTTDEISYGVAIGKRLRPNGGVEIAYTHFQGDVEVRFENPNLPPATGGPLKRDDILFNGVWYADRGTNTLPFVTAGIGASIFAAEGADSETRFAWMFGAGIRQDMSEKAGIRLGIRWMPMWVSTGTGVFCDPFFCYATDTGESYDQWEVNGGLVFKLGGQ
jgi:opacity protein-like surface antigen